MWFSLKRIFIDAFEGLLLFYIEVDLNIKYLKNNLSENNLSL